MKRMPGMILTLACLAILWVSAPAAEDPLVQGFTAPPADARPWTYWMWMDGQITREGITHDLEALKRIGVGGVLIMNLGISKSPAGVERVVFMTPQWRELVHHVMAEAARLGLQVDMNNDDGWNCGGPWVKPEDAMKIMTWSETRVRGGARYEGTLLQPPTKLDTYHDIAVLAVPAGVPRLPAARRTVQAGPAPFVQLAFDRAVTARALTVSITTATQPAAAKKTARAQAKAAKAAPRPKAAPRAKTQPAAAAPAGPQGLVNSPRPVLSARPGRCELQVSDDGQNFRTIKSFETGWVSMMAALPSVTVGLDEAAQGRVFRLLMPDMNPALAGTVNVTLEPEARVTYWRLKAGFEHVREHGNASPLYAMAGEYPKPEPGMFIDRRRVIDLTDKMGPDGKLAWDAPAGNWTILRIGYTPTAHPNGAATAEGRGLDSDKLSKPALEAHLAGMLDPLLADAGALVGKSFNWTHDDSWESGPLNWTAAFREEFKKRRGYDPVPWLPVMAGGRVVGSAEQSDRFLWDVRRTLADMLIDNHLKYFQELSHKRGIKFSSESSGRQQFMYDPIAFQATSDMPMGEFWASEVRPRPDCKIAASAAHILGLPVAGAEAFTFGSPTAGRWAESPYTFKTLGDRAFCFGINHFVFHRMLLQYKPDEKPGVTWPNIGINFDSTQTWWEMAGGWIDYLARCQYLLRQGRFVADAAVLTGQGAPSSFMRQLEPLDPAAPWDTSTITEGVLRRFGAMQPLPPVGYDYDGVDVATVMSMKVRDGRLVLPSGMDYRVLVLPVEPRMTAGLARKVRELVSAGAVVIGPKPAGSPSLGECMRGDPEVKKIAEEVWGDCDGKGVTEHAFGKGRVIWGKPMGEVLAALSLPPDFEYGAAQAGDPAPKLDFIHRRAGNTEIYFVSNQEKKPVAVRATFRASGAPQLWDPATGRRTGCAGFEKKGDCTAVPLQLDPAGSVFVVFGAPGAARPAGEAAEVFEYKGAWTVSFDPKWGGPESMRFEEPYDWTRLDVEGIKYYSGTAIYKTTLEIPDSALRAPNSALHLDLGEVREMARVILNGKDLGVAWKPPYRVEITGAARAGKNELEVRVANLWVNRLIGDSALPEAQRLTRTAWNPYTSASPLVPSGLLGPVKVLAEK